MAGLTLGMIGVMAIVAGGLVTAIMALPGVTPILLTIAVVYFGYLAFRIATAPPLSEATEHYGNPSFVVGVLQSFINPKAYAAMAALFSGFVLVQDRVDYDVASKMIVSITIIVVVNIIWLFAGAALTRLFKNRRTNRAVNVSFACVLIASMAFALLV